MNENLRRLLDLGVAVWLDDLDPDRLRTDEPRDVLGDGCVTGLCVGPSGLRHAVERGGTFDAVLRDLAKRQVPLADAVTAIVCGYATEAADLLRPVHDATGSVDGWVSIEVEPPERHDVAATLAAARRIWSEVDRPNVYLALPADPAGLPAITQALAEGINVNAAASFSPDGLRDAMSAAAEGLDRCAAAERGSRPSVAVSFAVSDIDTEVDKRLWRIGTDASARLRGTAALANARLAYAAYENALRDERWKRLDREGTRRPRLVWSATRVKDPYYAETAYLEGLVVAGAVTAMSRRSMDAAEAGGRFERDTVHGTYEDAYLAVGAVNEIGVDYTDVVRVLEDRALARSVEAWRGLRAAVEPALRGPDAGG